jgi:CheY-like chemotaxis protein
MGNTKKILLVDLDDARRSTRVDLLALAGYEVNVRTDYIAAESLDHVGTFDLIIIALHKRSEETASYSARLSRFRPKLPVLLLTDFGVFTPPGTLRASFESGNPRMLLEKVAGMLAGSTYVRELPISPMTADTTPHGFRDVEDWLLHQLYKHPKASHVTHSLLRQLNQVLQSEPSTLDAANELRSAIGKAPISAEEYGQMKERNAKFAEVQRAVEALIEAGWVKGDRYYTDLKLTQIGEQEAIRRERERRG